MTLALVLFFAIFATLSYAQENVFGCCFYEDKNLEKPVGCSNSTFKTTSKMQSWFCTPNYAGYIRKGGVVQAAVTCADTMGATNSPVEAEEFQVITPCPAVLNGVADCCFWTEANQKGEEMCLPSSSEAPAQPSKEYKSFQCFPRQKPKVIGRNVPCPRPGEPEKFDTPVKQADISTEPCETAPRAESSDEMLSSFEEVVNNFGALAAADNVDTFTDYNGDLAATDNVDTFTDYNGDLAAADFVDNTFTDYNGDLAATDFVDNTFGDYNGDLAAADFVDNTFGDYYGDFAATDYVDTTFNDYDLAAADYDTANFAATDFNEYYGDLAEADVMDSYVLEFGDGAAGVGGVDSTVQKAGAGQIVCTLMVLLVGLAFFL
jgi:hypothetical protein